ncbi:hypothetical protein A3731_40910 [Roseovarius sp. HI0049]|nr:hypothetical protein A3731_40910 [Roseovarius sp. HI0049]
MAINLNYLQRCPSFDAAFGRGYGEEVDWCQKTAAQGGLHVAVPNLFVEHRGGASFGSDEKWRRIAQNNALIARRYPKYDPMVQRFIANDPLVTPRLALALAYLDSLDDLHETPVFIAHTMGGGAENYLKARLEALSPAAAVILRFGGAARCQVEVLTPNGTTTGQTNDLDAVERLMQVLNRRRIIYSCAVGDPDPVELPDFFARVAQDQHLDVLFHDYFPISPSYTLLNRDGTYRGVPPPSSDDSAHCSRRMDGTKVSLEEWRHAWGKLMQQADRVIVFSKDSRALAISAYPETRHRIEVHPHKLTKLVPKVAPPQNDRTVIGVLGNIGPQKGAAVLQAASRLLRDTPNAELVLLGRIDPAFRLSSGTICHGNYDLEDIPFLIRRYGINIWFIPSIWPETFSYTTHESLATGLPVISFDLGAQGEAVTAAPNGHIVPMKGARSDTASLAARVIQTAIALRAQTG